MDISMRVPKYFKKIKFEHSLIAIPISSEADFKGVKIFRKFEKNIEKNIEDLIFLDLKNSKICLK